MDENKQVCLFQGQEKLNGVFTVIKKCKDLVIVEKDGVKKIIPSRKLTIQEYKPGKCQFNKSLFDEIMNSTVQDFHNAWRKNENKRN